MSKKANIFLSLQVPPYPKDRINVKVNKFLSNNDCNYCLHTEVEKKIRDFTS